MGFDMGHRSFHLVIPYILSMNVLASSPDRNVIHAPPFTEMAIIATKKRAIGENGILARISRTCSNLIPQIPMIFQTILSPGQPRHPRPVTLIDIGKYALSEQVAWARSGE